MGYPVDFKIPVSDTQAYKQFGNSVVVPVVERVALEVVATLNRPVDYKPDLVLSMDEPIRSPITPIQDVIVRYPKAKRLRPARIANR
jgi:hypothetical protein